MSEPLALNVPGCELWTVPRFSDPRGHLVVTEFAKHLPFIPKRTFFVSGVGEADVRGIHAHKECHQFLLPLQGSVVAVVDDGKTRQEITLDRLEQGLYMPPMIWGTQYKYAGHAVIAVFASHGYDADDYIHDYEQFRAAAAV